MATSTTSIMSDQDNEGMSNAALNKDSTIEISNFNLNQLSSSMPSTSNATTIEEEANVSPSRASRTDENSNKSASCSSSPGDESPVPTSNNFPTSHSLKYNQLNETLGEALETKAMVRLSEVLKTLP